MANHEMAIVQEKEPSERNKRQDLDHIHLAKRMGATKGVKGEHKIGGP